MCPSSLYYRYCRLTMSHIFITPTRLRNVDNLPFDIDGYKLVRACPEDMDFVMECVREDILCSVPSDEKDLRDLWIDDIVSIVHDGMLRKTMDSEVFKLVSEDGNAGMLWMGVSKDEFTCDETGYLLGIHVRKDLRGRGLGKALMRSAEEWCRSNSLLSLSLNVGSVNGAAIGLYRSMGYSDRSVVMRRILK